MLCERRSWVGAWLALLLSACGGGGGSGSSDAGANPTPTPDPQPAAAPQLSGLTPAQVSFELTAGQSADFQLRFSNAGDAMLTHQLSTADPWITLPSTVSGELAAGAQISMDVQVTCGEQNLSGGITLRTNDGGAVSTRIPVAAVCSPVLADFVVDRVLINQGARAFDSNVGEDFAVDLLAGRETLVRAFVTGQGPVPEAQIVLQYDDQSTQNFAMQTPVSVGPTPASDTLLGASHYVVLPAGVMVPGTQMRIDVGNDVVAASYPAEGQLTLPVEDPGTLEITFVPVTFEGQTPDIDPQVYMRDVRRVLPVGAFDVEVRAPYVFTGSYDLDDLLREMADLRNLDGSRRLYHGVIIPPAGSNSSTAGIGFVGFPVSVSVDLGGDFFVVAHEIGHNLNLGHAPGCGAPNADPNYPYPNAQVVSWGYDQIQDSLVPPQGRQDFMSYCQDTWVSDYHLNKALQFRTGSASTLAPSTADGLSISGQLNAAGIAGVRLLPSPHTERAYADHQLYRFVGWDVNGVQVADQSFAVYPIEDMDAAASFSFTVPKPTAPIDHYEIYHQDVVLSRDRVESAVRSTAAGAAVAQSRRQLTAIVRGRHGEVLSIDRSGLLAANMVKARQIDWVDSAGIVLQSDVITQE